jgi:hypothetical protein
MKKTQTEKNGRGRDKEKNEYTKEAAAESWQRVVLHIESSWRGATDLPLQNVVCYEMFHRAFPKYNKRVVSVLS